LAWCIQKKGNRGLNIVINCFLKLIENEGVFDGIFDLFQRLLMDRQIEDPDFEVLMKKMLDLIQKFEEDGLDARVSKIQQTIFSLANLDLNKVINVFLLE